MNEGIYGETYGAPLTVQRVRYNIGQSGNQYMGEALVLGSTDHMSGQTTRSKYGAPQVDRCDLVLPVPLTLGRKGQTVVGVGAILAQLPDGTVTGGNPRGIGAVDLQTSRNVATRVASGAYAVILGRNNVASGIESVALGAENLVTAFGAFAAGGSNTVSGSNATALGCANTANGAYSTAIGFGNSASGGYSVAMGSSNTSAAYCIAMGNSNTITNGSGGGSAAFGTANYISAWYSYALGVGNNVSGAKSFAVGDSNIVNAANATAIGANCTASGQYGFAVGQSCTASSNNTVAMGGNCTAGSSYAVAIGQLCNADMQFSHVTGSYGHSNGAGNKRIHSSNTFSTTYGVAQYGELSLHSATTDATPTVLRSNCTVAATTYNQALVPNNGVHTFDGLVVARQSAAQGTQTAAWRVEGLIRREGTAASTTLVVSSVTAISNVPGWGLALSADTANGALAVTFTGAAATNIRCTATLRTSETIYA